MPCIKIHIWSISLCELMSHLMASLPLQEDSLLLLVLGTFLFDNKGRFYAEEEAQLMESVRAAAVHNDPPEAPTPVWWRIKAKPFPLISALYKGSNSLFF